MNVDVTPNAFAPLVGTTVAVAANSSGVTVSLNTGGTQIRFYNSGTVPAFAAWGTGSSSAKVPSGATLGDMPIVPGAIEVFNKQWTDNVLSMITASSSATVYVTVGNGV